MFEVQFAELPAVLPPIVANVDEPPFEIAPPEEIEPEAPPRFPIGPAPLEPLHAMKSMVPTGDRREPIVSTLCFTYCYCLSHAFVGTENLGPVSGQRRGLPRPIRERVIDFLRAVAVAAIG